MFVFSLVLFFTGVSVAVAVLQHQESSVPRLASYSIGNAVPLVRTTAYSNVPMRSIYERKDRSGIETIATGVSFLAEIEVGGQHFYGRVETTSCDTWFIKPGYYCRTDSGGKAPAAECSFGQTFDPNRSSFKQIPGQVFNSSYVLANAAVGTVGTVPLKFAGLEIQSQEIGLVESARWPGDGISSGVIGLAYPYLTSAFRANNPQDAVPCYAGQDPTNSRCNQVRYSSLVNTIFNIENLTDPVFALALSRDESGTHHGGVLSFGGVPEPSDPRVNVKDVQNYGSARNKIPPRAEELSIYAVDVNGIVFPGSDAIISATPTAKRPGAATYIIDTNIVYNYYPKSVATAINAAFKPQAWVDESTGLYHVLCNSSTTDIPSVGIDIGGTTFYMNKKDMIHHYEDGRCISGAQIREGEGQVGKHWILGCKFLNNVLAVFDLRSNEIRFWSRMEYQS